MANPQQHLDRFSRRGFLSTLAAIPAAMALQSVGGAALAADAPSTAPAGQAKKVPIGLELYSVRGELARDLPNTLRNVAKIGYETVEFYAPYFE